MNNLENQMDRYFHGIAIKRQQTSLFYKKVIDKIGFSKDAKLTGSMVLGIHVPAVTEDNWTVYEMDIHFQPDTKVRVCNKAHKCTYSMERKPFKVTIGNSTSVVINSIVDISQSSNGEILTCSDSQAKSAPMCDLKKGHNGLLLGAYHAQKHGATIYFKSSIINHIEIWSNPVINMYTMSANQWLSPAIATVKVSSNGNGQKCDKCVSCLVTNKYLERENTSCISKEITRPNPMPKIKYLENILERLGEYVISEAKTGRRIEVEVDIVPFIRCEWPTWANQWNYNRSSGWPNETTVASIISNGAEIVRKSTGFILWQYAHLHKSNYHYASTHWSVGYNNAGKILVSSMNEEQKCLVIILQCLTNKYLRKYGGNPYHVYTLVFWMSETYGPNDTLWNSRIKYVMKALDIWHSMLKSESFMDYFQSYENYATILKSESGYFSNLLKTIKEIQNFPEKFFSPDVLKCNFAQVFNLGVYFRNKL